MSKRFKVEHNNAEFGVLYITLYHPPYEDENVVEKIKWKQKDVTITEIKREI